MTSAQLKKKIQLSPSDIEELKASLKDAGQKSGGKLTLVMSAESSSYAFWELFYAVLTAFLLTLCMLPLAPHVDHWIVSMIGENQHIYLSMFNLLSEAFVISLFYLLYNLPVFDRIIIPAGARHHAVSARAMETFALSGAYCSDAHNGILVYVSYFEREVRIIADKGISSVISQDLWNLIADELAESIKAGDVKAGFLHCIERCGELLADSFPPSAPASEESETQGLHILENERWA